jgi:hypothetical protein
MAHHPSADEEAGATASLSPMNTVDRPVDAGEAATTAAAARSPLGRHVESSSTAQEFLRSREKMYAENVENLHKMHGLDDVALAAAAAAITSDSTKADGAEAVVGILKQFNVNLAYSRVVPLREFVGWGDEAAFDLPLGPPEVALRRLVASLNFFGSSYFLVIAAAYVRCVRSVRACMHPSRAPTDIRAVPDTAKIMR